MISLFSQTYIAIFFIVPNIIILCISNLKCLKILRFISAEFVIWLKNKHNKTIWVNNRLSEQYKPLKGCDCATEVFFGTFRHHAVSKSLIQDVSSWIPLPFTAEHLRFFNKKTISGVQNMIQRKEHITKPLI